MEKVKLRIATKEDYPVYVKYLTDKDGLYHWFFYDENAKPVETPESEEARKYFGLDKGWVDEFIKENFEFKKKWFLKSFDYISQHRFYMILIDKKIVGYLEFAYSGNGSWKINNCALDVEQFSRREEIIAEAIKLKLPRVTRIYTMLLSETATKIFEKVGFKKSKCSLELVL